MVDGGEMARNPDVLALLEKHNYSVRPTAPDLSFQNAPDERPTPTPPFLMRYEQCFMT
jgi:hypothetical protein